MSGIHARIMLTFLIGLVIGFAISQAIQSTIDTSASSKIKRSIGNALAISDALERYKQDIGYYPKPSGHDNPLNALTPRYLRAVPYDTHNGKSYILLMTASTPTVISLGRGGFLVQKREVVFFEPYRPEDGKSIGQ